MKVRHPTGEKGIGRLAIAAIGPQVLLVTRALRARGTGSATASFVNWSLFALPGLSLDEIEVPIIQFERDELPDRNDLIDMVDAVRVNLRRLSGRIEKANMMEIEAELDLARFDANDLQSRFAAASLKDDGTGTQFFIQPVDPMLEDALDAGAADRRRGTGNLQRMLMGFTNTMTPDHEPPPVVAEFRDHRSSDLNKSVIGPDEFFTPTDFASADHHFHGRFDEYGQFSGTVGVYGQKPEHHTIVWPGARGRRTECGPFTIDFAYVQGAFRESRMTPENWERVLQKLREIGGLYIYRNGIRILPYGNPDHDFLKIEERRNLSAGYYFFSYRRMFGAINLPSASSKRLIEKAGREGFRENRAYRQFREILENFLIQLAAGLL